MSNTIDPVICPRCGVTASKETNNRTGESFIFCPACNYDSDDIRKFQVLESSSGGEVGGIVEAKTEGEAAIIVLKEMGYIIEEVE